MIVDPDDEAFGSPREILAMARRPAARFDGKIDDFEDAVEMVRVVSGPNAPPVHSVNGWPASFWGARDAAWPLHHSRFPASGPSAPEERSGARELENPVAQFKETEPLLELARPF